MVLADSRVEVPSPVDFRRVLRRFPTGMVAITSFDGAPVGLTVGSFTSISLRPLLVGFFVDRSSSSWPRIEQVGSFAVNLLAEHQADICDLFGRKGADRFAGVRWQQYGENGAPLIDGALAWIECEIANVVPTGDHLLVIGAVRRTRANDAAARGPLVFCGGMLTGLAIQTPGQGA